MMNNTKIIFGQVISVLMAARAYLGTDTVNSEYPLAYFSESFFSPLLISLLTGLLILILKDADPIWNPKGYILSGVFFTLSNINMYTTIFLTSSDFVLSIFQFSFIIGCFFTFLISGKLKVNTKKYYTFLFIGIPILFVSIKDLPVNYNTILNITSSAFFSFFFLSSDTIILSILGNEVGILRVLFWSSLFSLPVFLFFHFSLITNILMGKIIGSSFFFFYTPIFSAYRILSVAYIQKYGILSYSYLWLSGNLILKIFKALALEDIPVRALPLTVYSFLWMAQFLVGLFSEEDERELGFYPGRP